jgi:hypothetical protein
VAFAADRNSVQPVQPDPEDVTDADCHWSRLKLKQDKHTVPQERRQE